MVIVSPQQLLGPRDQLSQCQKKPELHGQEAPVTPLNALEAQHSDGEGSSQATTLTQGATPQDIATLQLYYQNPPPLQPPPSWARGFWRCIWSHWT